VETSSCAGAQLSVIIVIFVPGNLLSGKVRQGKTMVKPQTNVNAKIGAESRGCSDP
jgi:hypothetical protein